MKIFQKVKNFMESEETKEKINKLKEKSVEKFKEVKEKTGEISNEYKKKTEDYINEYKKKKSDSSDDVEKKEEKIEDADNFKKKEDELKENTSISESGVTVNGEDSVLETSEKDQVKKTLEGIGLSKKIIQSLNESGFNSLEELDNASDEEILSVDGVGKAALKKIRER